MRTPNPISTHPVRRRRVFYIPGYDPIHPRRYRELYRKESKLQAQISGYDIEIKPKEAGDIYGWSISATIDGQTTQSSVDVLVWSDIVRDSMARDIPRTYVQLVKTAWIYLRSGALLRLARLRKGPILAALYPVFMLLAQLIIAILASAAIAHLGSWIFSGSDAVFWVLLLVVPIFILRWFKSKDGKLFAYYLMHDFAHSAKDNGAFSPELKTRMSEFRQVLKQALSEDVDEVLVVGHSSGAHMAVTIISDLLRETNGVGTRPELAFLSLGQVVPMVSFLPDANQLRRDLNFLSARNDITWIDVTAPGDGCAFALCDPVGVTGVAPDDQRWPLILSAAFTQSLSAERWRELRWRFFRLHFQYLCAFDWPKDYDYFQITAGPLTLSERYRDRPPSKSRITHAVSGHRSLQ